MEAIRGPFALVAERAGIGWWRLDCASEIVHCSRTTLQMLRLTPADYLLPDFLRAFTSDDRERLVQHIAACGRVVGASFQANVKSCTANGISRDFEIMAESELDGRTAGLAISGIARDVTDLVRAKNHVRMLTDHMPALVGYWDRELRCCYANACYLEWFGRTSEEMLGIKIQDLMGPDLFAKNAPFIQAAMNGAKQTFERTLVKPSGAIGHTLAQYIPDFDDSGNVVGMYVLVSDVTRLKEAEIELKNLNVSLTAAATEARAANDAKAAFVSNVSHEVRNALTSILTFADLLKQQTALAERARLYVDRIADASDDLIGRMNDLLDISKLESGHVAFQVARFDPAILAQRVIALHEPAAERKQIRLRFALAELPEILMGDQNRIRQILNNLIANAVKFTAVGGVSLSANYCHDDGVLRFEVTDTGCGIAPENQQRLFQRFSQIEEAAASNPHGAGLGLAICRGFVEAMGGQIGVISALGEGSCFWVELPCARATSDRDLSDRSRLSGDLFDLR